MAPPLDRDLFGRPTTPVRELRWGPYPFMPGSGPKGETCATCAHRIEHPWKGSLCFRRVEKVGTHAADALARTSPACFGWEKAPIVFLPPKRREVDVEDAADGFAGVNVAIRRAIEQELGISQPPKP